MPLSLWTEEMGLKKVPTQVLKEMQDKKPLYDGEKNPRIQMFWKTSCNECTPLGKMAWLSGI